MNRVEKAARLGLTEIGESDVSQNREGNQPVAPQNHAWEG